MHGIKNRSDRMVWAIFLPEKYFISFNNRLALNFVMELVIMESIVCGFRSLKSVCFESEKME